MRTLLALITTAFTSITDAQETFTLGNGAKIIIVPVRGVDWIGVESFYDVGFVDEPRGLTQISHLAEHLMCMGDINDDGAGTAWRRLNEVGTANAETMGILTHYDAMVPAESLDLVLEIEAGRLDGIGFDQDLLIFEASRCHAEAAGIQMSPQAPMYKFALMAAIQAWRFGATEARVVEGLEAIKPKSMIEFLANTYVPENLTLIIYGDVDPDDAKARIEQTIGTVPARGAVSMDPIDFTDQPALHDMAWDSVPATIVCYAPPSDPAHQLVLSLYGAVLMRPMMSDAQIQGVSRTTLPSSHLWPVGPMPMHVYATLAEGVDAADAERTIAEWIESRPALTDADAAFIKGYATQATRIVPPHPATVRAQAEQVRRFSSTTGDPVGMVLANAALQTGLAQRLVALYGEETCAEVAAMSTEDINEIIESTIAAERRFITRLTPAD